MQTDILGSSFEEDDEGSYGDRYVVVAVFRNRFGGGICTADDSHKYKHGDLVGKLERTDNPLIPVTGVCCNRCVRSLEHKDSA